LCAQTLHVQGSYQLIPFEIEYDKVMSVANVGNLELTVWIGLSF